jgi:ATP-binding cassette subfamily C protein
VSDRHYSPAARRFVRQEIRRHPAKLALFLAMSLVAACLEVTGVALVFPLLYILADPSSIARFPPLEQLTQRLGIVDQREIYLLLIILIGLMMVAKGAYMALFYHFQLKTIAEWKTALSQRLMRTYLFSGFDVHMRKTTSEIILNISLTAMLYDRFVLPCIVIVTNVVVALGLTALLLLVLPGETMLGVTVLAVAALALYLGLRRRVIGLGSESAGLFRVRQRLLQQAVGAIRETKILGKEGYFSDRFGEIESESFRNQRHYTFLSMMPSVVTEIVVVVALLGLVASVLLNAEKPSDVYATLGVLAGTMFRLAPQFNRILGSFQMLNLSKYALETVASELEELEQRLYFPPPDLGRLELKSALRLDEVSYGYPEAEADAVRDLTLRVETHEFIGITGASGSGKTTLLALMMGLLRPDTGSVSVDGNVLDDPETVRRWQNSIGYVSQNMFMVEESLLANIAYGVAPEDVDRDRVRRAVDLAQLEAFVSAQPHGLDEGVGEYGSRLSGGERQRVGIARALYIEPSFLALDEATSALDAKTEREVTDALAALHGRQTMVVIAHRLSTLRECDRIVMMQDGRILGLDSFEALYRHCPPFRQLVELSRLREDGLLDEEGVRGREDRPAAGSV